MLIALEIELLLLTVCIVNPIYPLTGDMGLLQPTLHGSLMGEKFHVTSYGLFATKSGENTYLPIGFPGTENKINK